METRVNRNVPIKTYYNIFYICIFAIFLFMAGVFYELNKTKNYIQTEAEVIKVTKEYGKNRSNKNSYHNYIHFRYSVNKESYQNKFPIILVNKNKVGKKIKIYYSKDNPLLLRNTSMINTEIFFVIFLSIFCCFLSNAIQIKKGEIQE